MALWVNNTIFDLKSINLSPLFSNANLCEPVARRDFTAARKWQKQKLLQFRCFSRDDLFLSFLLSSSYVLTIFDDAAARIKSSE